VVEAETEAVVDSEKQTRFQAQMPLLFAHSFIHFLRVQRTREVRRGPSLSYTCCSLLLVHVVKLICMFGSPFSEDGVTFLCFSTTAYF
jgi:hypothetical protein